MFNQVLFIAIVREDHWFSFGITAEHYISVEDIADLPEEGRRTIFKLLWRNVDHQN